MDIAIFCSRLPILDWILDLIVLLSCLCYILYWACGRIWIYFLLLQAAYYCILHCSSGKIETWSIDPLKSCSVQSKNGWSHLRTRSGPMKTLGVRALCSYAAVVCRCAVIIWYLQRVDTIVKKLKVNSKKKYLSNQWKCGEKPINDALNSTKFLTTSNAQYYYEYT